MLPQPASTLSVVDSPILDTDLLSEFPATLRKNQLDWAAEVGRDRWMDTAYQVTTIVPPPILMQMFDSFGLTHTWNTVYIAEEETA